jgi:hypothetical protein
MNYENRIVLFLDILGFKSIIGKTLNKNEDDEKQIQYLYDTLKRIGSFVRDNFKRRNGNWKNNNARVTQFSDSIIVSFIENDEYVLLNLINIIQDLIIYLADNGLLCRGAITYGKLIHTGNVIFGPALNDAYETETRAALYPRVILDKTLLDLSKANLTEFLPFEEFMSNKEQMLSYLLKDTDDKFYINYFPEYLNQIPRRNSYKNYLINMRTTIINGSKSQKPDLQVKFGWLKNKYNHLIYRLQSEEKIQEISKEKGLFEYVNKLKTLK